MIDNNQGRRFARLLWLYGEIASKGPVTFQQISDSWRTARLNDGGEPLPRRTFDNHRKDIESLFDVNIDCNRANNTYFVATQLDYVKATLDMLNGALLFSRTKSDPQMARHIRPEQKSGEDTSRLFTVTDAIAEGRTLRLRYRHNYDPQRERDYCIKPVAVKQFRNRWYIVGELDGGRAYSFPLDRVLRLEKGEHTEPSRLDVDELFADAFGIIREDSVKADEIILRVEREQANYFLSLPLHSSQRVVAETPEAVTFRLRLAPTYDFIMELLSHGPKVEVLAPQSLRNQIAAKITEMHQLYNS